MANLALAHLGSKLSISDIDSDRGQDPLILRTFLPITIQTCLEDFHWGFATKFAKLTLIEEIPNSEWRYSYVYPNDCVDFRRILSGKRNDDRQSMVSFIQAVSDDARLIFTDKQNAECEYTKFVDDPRLWPPSFFLAASFKLAYLSVPSLTGGDPFNLRTSIGQNYTRALAEAKVNSGNSQVRDEQPKPELIRARR